jgi:hypothetical protein
MDRQRPKPGPEALQHLRDLAELPPRMVIDGALAMNPTSVLFVNELDQLCARYNNRFGLPISSICVLTAACAGFGLGRFIDTKLPGAGEAADSFAEALTNVLRYAMEDNFAEARKEQARG